MAKTYVDRPVDGIRWPVGPKKDPAETHYISSGFCDEAYHYKRGFWHPGEDWNGKGGGDSDLGDDVYTIADGRIVGKDFYPVWGNIIVIVHLMPNAQVVWSQYAHLEVMTDLKVGAWVQGGQAIGTIGKGADDRYVAHLHFEIRQADLPPDSWQVKSRAIVERDYLPPSLFIREWSQYFNA